LLEEEDRAKIPDIMGSFHKAHSSKLEKIDDPIGSSIPKSPGLRVEAVKALL
jgi:hypothetical protein